MRMSFGILGKASETRGTAEEHESTMLPWINIPLKDHTER